MRNYFWYTQSSIQNTLKILNNVVHDFCISDLFCLHREDGRYPHPVNCHVYILCSNSYAYSITCPQGLVFAPNGHGCNFDHSGYCDRKAKEGLLRNKLSTKSECGRGGAGWWRGCWETKVTEYGILLRRPIHGTIIMPPFFKPSHFNSFE